MGRGRSKLNNGYRTFSNTSNKTGGNFLKGSFEKLGVVQEKFFSKNTNMDALVQKIENDPELRSDLVAWIGGHFVYGQQYDGWDNMSEDEKILTQNFDDLMDGFKTNAGFTVVRNANAQLLLGKGNISGTLEDFKAMEGNVITCKGNMSFSAAKTGLDIFANAEGTNIQYKLNIPKGSEGAGCYIGDRRAVGVPNQLEFTTNRDIALKVGKSSYDSKKNIYTVELEYVGRLEHDYGTSGRVKK